MRTLNLVDLKTQCSGAWHTLDQDEIDKAFETPFQDAKDAVRYSDPDIIIGSSLGGAILFKLIAEGEFSGASVFLAPAITNFHESEYVCLLYTSDAADE